MNKIKSTLIFIIIFVFTYFLNIFFSKYTIFGVKPNLFLIVIVITGISFEKYKGAIFGFIYGFLVDIMQAAIIGINAIPLCIIGYVSGLVKNYFSKDNKITVLILVAMFTILYDLIQYCIKYILFLTEIEVITLFKTIGIEVAFNCLLSIIIYYYCQKVIARNKKGEMTSKRFRNYI